MDREQIRDGGTYTQPIEERDGSIVFVAYVAWKEAGRHDSAQGAEQAVRAAFEGREIREIA